MSAHPKVRPYVVSTYTRAGRAGAGVAAGGEVLLVHTLVWAHSYDPVYAAGLAPEARRVYRRACGGQRVSVAELSAAEGLPLGVVRVIAADLAADSRLVVGGQTTSEVGCVDRRLLERVRDGLRNLA